MCGRGGRRSGGTAYKHAVLGYFRNGKQKGLSKDQSLAAHKYSEEFRCGIDVSNDNSIDFPDQALVEADYNIAPGRMVPILFADTHDRLQLQRARWGFKGFGQLVINARSETVCDKVMFKNISQNRCVVFLSGFYEWNRTAHGNRPYYVTLREGSSKKDLMPVAALMKTDKADGLCFTILTTRASPEFAWCHPRQPVILPGVEATWQWLSRDPIARCLSSFLPCTSLQWHEVHPMVGNVRNNSPKCMEPLLDAYVGDASADMDRNQMMKNKKRKRRDAAEKGVAGKQVTTRKKTKLSGEAKEES